MQSFASTQVFTKHLYWLALLALLAISCVIYMGKSYERSLKAIDASMHARLALQVTSQGIAPTVPMRDMNNGVFNDHPFTLFYLTGWIMRLFGADAWSARLLPSGFAVGCVLLTAWFGLLLRNRSLGLASGIVLAFNPELIGNGATFQLDPALTFFIILSFITWWKNWPIRTGLAAGLGVWMKSPVAFLIFPSALLALLLTKQLNIRQLRSLSVAFVTAVIVGFSI